MNNLKLIAKGIRKVFDQREVFSGINVDLEQHQSLVITGQNGSGKSTLIKILCGVLQPTDGKVFLQCNGKEISDGLRFRYIGFVAPYLQLYDEFNAYEQLDLFCRIRAISPNKKKFDTLLDRVGILNREYDLVRTYSSGMKQRLKYACALVHEPALLMLDEPTCNLDDAGREIVGKIIEEQKLNGSVIIATNEVNERNLGDSVIDLDQLKQL